MNYFRCIGGNGGGGTGGTAIEYLFEPADLIANYYIETNGNQAAYNGWSCTDFIPVTAGETLYCASRDNRNWNCWYDSNQNFISNFAHPSTGYGTLTVPANAAYVRFSDPTADITNYIRYWRELT